MNKEIKEILEIFKQVDLEQEIGGCYNCPKKDKDKTCIGCLNNAKDKLLDYINNLQQEKEKAIEYIERVKTIIEEQPRTDVDDFWILEKLQIFLDILKGSDSNE